MSEHVDLSRPPVDDQAQPRAASSRLRDLHPGWLAAVMGTAILAVATDADPGGVSALAPVGHAVGGVLAVAAYAIGAVLLVAYLLRWARHTRACVADLRHPVLGGLHATLPGAILVLAVMTAALGERLMPAGAVTVVIAVLAVVGTTLALLFGVAFGYALFTGDAPAGAVNGGWFIPPVVTVIVPMALTPLMPHVSADAARLLLFAGYAFLGLGFMLFLLVLGMLHDRLVLHPLPPAQLAPSLWIALGPIGVSALVPMNLARAGQVVFADNAPVVTTVSLVFATAIWGFRPVVAGDRRRAARALPAHRPGAVPPRLVGVRLPAGRVHRGHPHPGSRLVPAGCRRVRGPAVPRPAHRVGGRGDPHGRLDALGSDLAALTGHPEASLAHRKEPVMSTELLDRLLALHGHRCWASTAGVRVAQAALDALGLSASGGKSLHAVVDIGDHHGAMCFADGVQVTNGCTFGKGNIAKSGKGTLALTLIDTASDLRVKVAYKPALQPQVRDSAFMRKRGAGVPASEIPEAEQWELVDLVWDAPADDVLIVGTVEPVVLSGVMAMVGLGAAFLFVPLLYWLGIPLPVAASTALLLNAVSLSFATVTYWRARLVNLALGIPLTVAAVVAAPVGARVAPHVDTAVLLWLLAAFLVFAGAMMLFYRRPEATREPGRVARIAAGTAVGGGAGFLGGLLGVGGGNVILPSLNTMGLDPKEAAGTTAFAVVFSSLSGFAGRVSLGDLDGRLIAVSVVAAAAGSSVGSRLMVTRVTSGQLKRLVAIVLWLVAAKMAWDLVVG
ncbi:MAG: TSUP family transporter [Actinomycetales bacterium]|nr:TSUP family transporter [Actinomycetales bacterium]